MKRCSSAIVVILGITCVPVSAQPKTGLQQQVKVEKPTRLDWKFAAQGFGQKQDQLPPGYRSQEQKFWLYVPPTYVKTKSWPLLVFISPSDAPLGWRHWQKVCIDNRMIFCAAYGAGNRTPAGKRLRIVLDMVDQVRRQYNVDPEQTYVTGFSGGGRIACTVAFSLPEYFGGVIPVCGTNPLNRLDYLRHRTQDRLSVAFVTGEKDFNRDENEKLMHPILSGVGARTKLWVVKDLGHAIPKASVLAEVLDWMKEDLENRQKELKTRPWLAHVPDEKLTPGGQAEHWFQAARNELREKDRTWRAVTLLQGVRARWPKTRAAEKATELLKTVANDEEKLKLVAEQGGKDERSYLHAQAKAFEQSNRSQLALQVWKQIADRYPQTPEGQQAKMKIQQLEERMEKTPYLGVRFVGASTRVAMVVADGPADKGDLMPNDKITRIDTTFTRSLKDVQKALKGKKPGDVLNMDVEREGKRITLRVTLGKLPS